ncbi:MAG: hypothetical protein HY074_09430 [Deltaproteobacteria bacterium]|nr:hypothetical protein [Deltaproteobacteria bacterium]
MFNKLKKVFGSDKRTQQPRGARVPITALSGIQFSLNDSRYPKIDFEVVNLSENGIGLCNAPVIKVPPAGSTFKGAIILPDAKCPTELKVIYASATNIGCAFVNKSPELQTRIQQLFQLEISAMNLLEVPADQLKTEDDGKPRLFRGRNNCELLLVEQEQTLVRFRLVFFGNYIAGGTGLTTKCGFMGNKDAPVRIVSSLSPEVLRSAARFLSHIPQLNEAQRSFLQQAIAQLEH